MESKLLSKSKQKIFLVDDHTVVREGLRWIIVRDKNLEVCGEAGDAAEALDKIKRSSPDLVLVDIALPGMNGFDLIKNIREFLPNVRIIILSMFKESLYAARALRAGANGYIMKRDGGEKLISGIKEVLQGKTYISEEFNQLLLKKLSAPETENALSTESLTNRELGVLRLIGQGHSSREIATALEISIKTVEVHRVHIRAKLKMSTNSELVQYAIHWVHTEYIPH